MRKNVSTCFTPAFTLSSVPTYIAPLGIPPAKILNLPIELSSPWVYQVIILCTTGFDFMDYAVGQDKHGPSIREQEGM